MSNVVSMEKPCDYLVRRAAARRRKGAEQDDFIARSILRILKEAFGGDCRAHRVA